MYADPVPISTFKILDQEINLVGLQINEVTLGHRNEVTLGHRLPLKSIFPL
jgi:hypothetical protein